MTEFETHPVGTADLVKRLREDAVRERLHALEQDFWHEEILIEAADRIEQLEAALTLANAATAAAYEVAAQIADDFVQMRERQIETEKEKAAHHVDVPQIMRWQAGKVQSEVITSSIRALATPDQSAALDRLIAEAKADALAGPWVDEPDIMTPAVEASYPHITKDYKTWIQALELVSARHSKGALVALVNHLLAASKKGGA